MSEQEASYDYQRYRQLLSEAVDEASRLRLISLLIAEKARDRLEVQRASDRDAMTAETVAKVLGTKGLGTKGLATKALGDGRREQFQRG
ncbi:hypothetical protein [Bradyrhizobium tropiciagri]|uniref:hypothetical protein n=1 Tax=Bradyrhizobium tropiciagri TaxID=312253 RepID=UPI001FCD1491|nr:hypothetical protein [Bradyrhizobium tropiciagri]